MGKLVALGSVLVVGVGVWVATKVAGSSRPPPEPVMAPCVFLGDSLAVGAGRVAPECVTRASGGIQSDLYARMFPGLVRAQALAVLSLGTNDALPGVSVDTLAELRTIRARVAAPRVVWLGPVKATDAIKQAVATVAGENGDEVMDIGPEAASGPDGIHPTYAGYRSIVVRLLP